MTLRSTVILLLTRTVWKKLIHALWKSFQSDFGTLLGKLRRHQRLIETQSDIIQFENSLRAREEAERISQDLRAAEKARQLRTVQDWLSSVNAKNDQQALSSIRREHPNSGRWILTVKKFQDWFGPGFCKPQSL